VPVVANVTAAPETDPQRLRQLLLEQVTAPVRWTESILALAGMGVDRAIEAGPGSVLRGLGRRITRDIKISTAGTADEIEGFADSA
jgi:[acyl-carrier-protein] S-malonyltransferase